MAPWRMCCHPTSLPSPDLAIITEDGGRRRAQPAAGTLAFGYRPLEIKNPKFA
jgi:hypothetical protein